MWFGTWSGVSILDFSLDPIPDPNFEQALIDLGIDKNGLTGDILRSEAEADRKSTRLNSSHVVISYAVFCLKKKKKIEMTRHI